MLPKTWQLRILKWLGSGYYFEQGDRLYSVSEVEGENLEELVGKIVAMELWKV